MCCHEQPAPACGQRMGLAARAACRQPGQLEGWSRSAVRQMCPGCPRSGRSELHHLHDWQGAAGALQIAGFVVLCVCCSAVAQALMLLRGWRCVVCGCRSTLGCCGCTQAVFGTVCFFLCSCCRSPSCVHRRCAQNVLAAVSAWQQRLSRLHSGWGASLPGGSFSVACAQESRHWLSGDDG